MFVTVNGARLYFDVESAGLVPDGAATRERPTLLLHGGPGFDHSGYRPAFSALADVAQVIYLDHRGNGRSGGTDPADWTLAQQGNDVRGFCDALGIVKPIVLGTSFGGFVAQSYATRHPDHPGKLILASTAARMEFPLVFEAFERLGGTGGAGGGGLLARPSSTSRLRYRDARLLLYRGRPGGGPVLSRGIIRDDVAIHFNGPANEHGRMDFRDALRRCVARCW